MSIPEALSVKPMASVDTMEIDTNILNPIVRTDTFMRFVLMKKGILDPGSCIALSIDAGSTDGVLPISTGIHALVKQAVLRIGSKVVAVTDSYPEYATIRRQFQTQEEKSQKDMVRVGTMDSICPERDNTGAGNGGEYSLRDVVPGAATVLNPLPQFALTTSGADNNQYYIKLSQLFPAMRNVSLPLYLINEPCSIEITFNKQVDNTQNGTVVEFNPQVANNLQSAKVNINDAVFLADYLTYTDERMNRLAEMVMSDSGLVIPYLDVVTTNTSFAPQATAAGAISEVQEIHDLGLAGMKVQSILGFYHDSTDDAVANPLGRYGSKAYTVPLRYNIRVNDKQVYPIDIDSETMKAHQLSQVFGTDINVGSGEYSFNALVSKANNVRAAVNNNYFNADGLLTDALGAGALSIRGMEGNLHYVGCDFTIDGGIGQGVMVGQTPIRIISNVTHQSTDQGGRTITYFSIVERQMSIKGGNVVVSG